MNVFDFFHEIKCINLDHRTDRWNQIQEVAKILQIPDRLHRFSGIQPTNVPLNRYNDRGRAGCALSHINIVREAYEKKYSNVLIFEDDILPAVPPEMFNATLQRCIEQLPSNWEIFYLSAHPTPVHGHSQSVVPYSNDLWNIRAAHTTHAIAINNNIYTEIINNSPDENSIYAWLDRFVAVDVFYVKLIQQRGKTFMPRQLLITQRNSYSDVEFTQRDNERFIQQSYRI